MKKTNKTQLIQNYAQALYNASLDDSSLENVVTDCEHISKALINISEFKILNNPQLKTSQKTQIAHEEFEENITLSKEGATNATLCVQNLTLCPSTSRTYTVHLKCKASGTYRILLDYEEKNDGGLKPFVNVTVRVGGEDAWQGTLAELLDGQTVPTLTGELQAKEPFDVQVIYTMPEQVGNEAQDTFSDFEIHFIIEKE